MWNGRAAQGNDDKVKAAKQISDANDAEVEEGLSVVDIATLACHCSIVPLTAELVGRLVGLSAARHQAGVSKVPRSKLVSLLVAAFMLAIHSILEPTTSDGVNIEGNVPMSERNLELGHPAFLGNLMTRHLPQVVPRRRSGWTSKDRGREVLGRRRGPGLAVGQQGNEGGRKGKVGIDGPHTGRATWKDGRDRHGSTLPPLRRVHRMGGLL